VLSAFSSNLVRYSACIVVSAVWNFPLGIPCYEARINL
jgi:hypothetical protein